MKRIMAVLIFLSIHGLLPPSLSSQVPSAHPFNNNPFAFTLLHAALHQDSSHSNQLISPLSIYLGMGLLYNGAGNATKDSIAEALQINGMDIPNLNALCKNMLQEIHLEDNKVQLSVAHSLWYNRKKSALLPSFEATVESYYYATPQSLNFSAPAAAARINGWVSQNTARKIATVLPRTNPKDCLYLVDAAFFNGDWLYPFEAGDTYKGLFYLPNGKTKMVSIMKKEFVTRVFSDTSFTMVELPYGNGKAFSMYVLMPDDPQQSPGELAASLSEEKLIYALGRMNDQYIQLCLPSWECAYSMGDMKSLLSQLGLGIVFNREGDADFSGMVKGLAGKTTLSRAIHNTYIKVNERGTRASGPEIAAPGSVAEQRCHRILALKADHPFLYLILEKQRNILLFAGVVNDPAGHY